MPSNTVKYTRKDVDGLIGQYEAEEAVLVLLRKMNEQGVGLLRTIVTLNDFVTDQERTGFCCLLCWGWFDAIYPNGYFWPDIKLYEAIKSRDIVPEDVLGSAEDCLTRLDKWVKGTFVENKIA